MSLATMPTIPTRPTLAPAADDVPPTLRIWVSYPAGGPGPESLEIVVDDHGGPADAKFICTLIRALIRPDAQPSVVTTNPINFVTEGTTP